MRKDIQVIIPYAVGSGMGQVFRVMQKYGAQQGVNLIPTFRPGAETMVALNEAATGTHDPERTIVFTVASDTIINRPHKKFNRNDFVPVAALVQTKVYIVASNNSPVNNLNELFDSMKKEPGKLNWAVANSQFYDDIKSMSGRLGVPFENLVITRFAGSPSIQNVVGGFYDVAIYPAGIVAQHIENKRLKLIGAYRRNDVPNSSVDTVENHMDILKKNGYGVFLLKGTSGDTAKFWSEFCKGFLNDPESRKILIENHFLPAEDGVQLMRQLLDEYKSEISLTPREEEVLGLIKFRGLSNQQISRQLGIGESAVKLHVSQILKKYHLRSRTQLAAVNSQTNG